MQPRVSIPIIVAGFALATAVFLLFFNPWHTETPAASMPATVDSQDSSEILLNNASPSPTAVATASSSLELPVVAPETTTSPDENADFLSSLAAAYATPTPQVGTPDKSSAKTKTPQQEPSPTTPTEEHTSDNIRVVIPPANNDTGNLQGAGLFPGFGRPSQQARVVPTPTATPRKETWYTGQARGYAILYLMHPRARPGVLKEIEIMKRSKLRELYLGVLVDGTFTQDYPFLQQVIKSLSEEGRTLTLALYLTNGSTQRNFSSSPIEAGFNAIDQIWFRELIVSDRQTRAEFKEMIDAAIPTIDFTRAQNPAHKVIVIPMLEDNLDMPAYEAMREMISEKVGNRVTIIRNPFMMKSRIAGTEWEPNTENLEYHAPSAIGLLEPGDGYTLDGAGFFHQDDQPLLGEYSVEEISWLLKHSMERGAAYFGLWRFERQGTQRGKIDPDLRPYEVPTESQIAAEIELLRSGLSTVELDAKETPGE